MTISTHLEDLNEYCRFGFTKQFKNVRWTPPIIALQLDSLAINQKNSYG